MSLLPIDQDGARTSWVLKRALGVLVATCLFAYFHRGYRIRKLFRSIQNQGIPILKHSMILGHLEVIGKLLSGLPSDAHGDYMMVKIQENWRELFPQCTKCPPVLYLDMWPFAAPILISIDANISSQFTQEHSLPKAYQQKQVLYPLSKNRDISSMEGAEWKVWRKRLNPGFSIQNITSRIPDIVDEVEDFAKVLQSHAAKDGEWGDVFAFENATTNLALDVSLRFFLNKRFHEQWGNKSPICTALQDTISKMVFFLDISTFVSYYDPWRHFKLWKNYRTLTNHLTPAIFERLSELQTDRQLTNKTLVDLVVQAIDDEKAENPGSTQAGEDGTSLRVDTAFIEEAVGQINTFLFAGFDTTSATICWLFRLLEQHPDVLSQLRKEHDTVLGPNPTDAADALKADPQLLNQLPYTHAVLRESMRVHTNVGTMRRGEPGFFLIGPTGSGPGFEEAKLPTDGFVVWDGSFAIHRDPELWHRAAEFLPERFLVTDEKDPLYPPRNAWRSFAAGPRNCIGQNLAIVEIKLVMALVVRSFDIECAWNEWDQSRQGTGASKGASPVVWGDRCYQVGRDSPPRVKDGMPVHVRVRQHVSSSKE